MMDLFLTPFLYPMKPLNNASAQLGVERKDVRVILTNKRDSGFTTQNNTNECSRLCSGLQYRSGGVSTNLPLSLVWGKKRGKMMKIAGGAKQTMYSETGECDD